MARQWTLSFNLVALAALAHARPFAPVAHTEAAEATEAAEPVAGFLAEQGLALAASPLVGVSQIFVVNIYIHIPGCYLRPMPQYLELKLAWKAYAGGNRD